MRSAWAAALVVALALLDATGADCPITQFRCSTGRCVNLNAFCDGRNDCGDNSDEPPACTHCNRTYYAASGESYRLLVNWPKPSQMPFLCYLTFSSATHDPSELLQVRLDTATIGQYLVPGGEAGNSNRCPDGWMQIWEGDQPVMQGATAAPDRPRPGVWCGASVNPRFYYAESASVTFAIRLLSIPNSLLPKFPSQSSSQQLHPVLDLTYKILTRSAAVVRYGTGGSGSRPNLGEQMIGSQCSRSFRQCGPESGSACRVQSPGYPGIYPRNAHCLYRIAHRSPSAAPANRRHVVVLWQSDARKISLRDWEQPAVDAGPPTPVLLPGASGASGRVRSAAECEASGDYITLYDGPSSTSPVLARFCDGPLPEVVASGPEVTVEFRSSPCDTIYAGHASIEGFELNVRIELVDANPAPAVPVTSEPGKCQWNVTSTGMSRGVLTPPRQTWPPHTACQFRFYGRPDERVWVHFAKYHFAGSVPRAKSATCRNALRISEGEGAGWDPYAPVNVTNRAAYPKGTIGLFCRDRPPPLCERQWSPAMKRTERPAPCLPSESFVSEGSALTIQQQLPDGTAFSAWSYAISYEFVRELNDGMALDQGTGSGRCDRLFTVQGQMRGSVKSPQNVFLFGRGGSRNLKCVYRFQGTKTMRVAVEVTRLRLGGRSCLNVLDPVTYQRRCVRNNETEGRAFVQLLERPWGSLPSSVVLERDCLCDAGLLPFRYISTGSTLDVVFRVDGMAHADDQHDFFYEIAYEFVTGVKCPSQSELSPVRGPGGFFALQGAAVAAAASPPLPPPICSRHTWILQARPGRLLFLSLPGFRVPESPGWNATQHDPCPTRNRVVVYSDFENGARALICPEGYSDGSGVQIFSSTHDEGSLDPLASQWARSKDIETDSDWTEVEHVALPTSSGVVVVEFVSLQSAAYQVKWLELARPTPGSERCATWCPELKACIDPLLWCDGVVDCPSKSDEMPRQCQSVGSNPARGWIFPKAYWYLVAAGSTLLVLFVIVSSVLVCRGNVHHTKSRPMDYDLSNGELVTPVGGGGGISPVSGGSFRPPPVPIAPLNDYVHPGGLKKVASGANIGSGLVVGAPKPGILVDRSAVYDKKLAVS